MWPARECLVRTDLFRSPRLWLWAAPGLVWLLFCLWYTNTSGPISEAERGAFLTAAAQMGWGDERLSSIERFMEEDEGGQFLMVNLLDLADDPEAGANMNRYMEHMLPALLERACHPTFAGDVVHQAMDLTGIEGAETWGSVGIVRYRSRRDLLEIAMNPVFSDKHDYKIEALAKTIAVPVAPSIYLSDLRLFLLLVLLAVIGIANALWPRR